MKSIFTLQRTLSCIKIEIHEIMSENNISWEDLATILSLPVESLKLWDNDQWRYVTVGALNQVLEGLEVAITAKKDKAKQDALETLKNMRVSESR